MRQRNFNEEACYAQFTSQMQTHELHSLVRKGKERRFLIIKYKNSLEMCQPLLNNYNRF